uniref:ZP domain-containing protein n=1 Tax=Panagrolaimus davidi TaxID=227884 RepID=A0A914QEG9_9BILA
MFETDLPFSGNVYAKGYFHKDTCRVHGDGIGNTVNITIPINADCGMRRRRMVSQRQSLDANNNASPKGIVFETTVVIMFHKLFLTKSDKAFHIECRYEQTNEIYTQKLEVSMIPPTDIPSVNDAGAASPKCKYEVLEENENGPPLSFAAIGQPVYHKWSCETSSADMHCLTVHSCMVDDGQGLKQDLLDSDGCPVDTVLLDSIDYKGDLEAGKDSFVFKFADKPTVFFSCQLRVEPKDMDTGLCVRTSDHCNNNPENSANSEASEDTTSSVSIEPDFPRPSTPKFKITTPSSMFDEFTDILQSEMPNSSEHISENGETMMAPETTTPIMVTKRKKIKARRFQFSKFKGWI